ncbi:hypothetical protein ASPZODRAFT_133622 [Penicilliopsis zonata CBS 506.65]|uniref:Centromere protein X n=1 Tax=Penicilliopsis zonata CBS 506.65 TaxID=1073090 RepID=A0A1L9SF20_9EURO|nr:hypothetical protein ASPZODRAFT_133622 [Penicilliopsis zonata CBS 506.65]OJJ45752.1 hypothetical protein ASPZODRAFT_133622 [Penicilliopsis zonata CBS 506.65]
MPVEGQPAQKRRRLPFKPPRPQTAAAASVVPSSSTAKPKQTSKTSKKTSATASASSSSKPARKSKPPKPRSPTPVSVASGPGSQAGSDAESDSRSRASSVSEEPEYILAEITTAQTSDDVLSSEPTIPSKLLTRLLHQHFRNEKTKIAKDANEVVAKYVDIFVREALARAAYERTESQASATGATRSGGDGFLEVEDLEKMAPQLVLDF